MKKLNFVYDGNSAIDWRVGDESTGCPGNDGGAHSYNTVTEAGYPATCNSDGKTAKYKCDYCESTTGGTLITDRPAHNNVTVKGKAATCTSTGLTDGTKCSACGTETKKQETIAALGHSYGADGACTRSGCSAVKEDPAGVAEGTPSDNPVTEPTGDAVTEPAASEAISVTEATETISATDGTEGAEAIETTLATEPIIDDDHGLFGCNPFSCGCWIYLLLALIIGVVLGFILGSQKKKKKRSKRRPRPYTEVDYNAAAMPTVAENAVVAAPVAAQAPAGSGVTAAVHQHIGARKDQQDSYGVSDLNAYPVNGVLAVVADGMGGLANGAAVSSTLVHGLLNYFRQTTGKEKVPDMMLDMLTQSNDQINRMLQGAERSGSTLVSAIVRGGYLHFLTVGDSRIYLYRDGMLLQLNREHIYQEELAVKAVNHIIPLAQVTGDRQAHALTSYLGIGRLTHLDRNYEGIKLEPGDRILLASDGVFGTLSQEDMEEALRNGIGDATAIIGDKIRKANMQYQDNNTALVLEYHG